jgi:hypothetical protein
MTRPALTGAVGSLAIIATLAGANVASSQIFQPNQPPTPQPTPSPRCTATKGAGVSPDVGGTRVRPTVQRLVAGNAYVTVVTCKDSGDIRWRTRVGAPNAGAKVDAMYLDPDPVTSGNETRRIRISRRSPGRADVTAIVASSVGTMEETAIFPTAIFRAPGLKYVFSNGVGVSESCPGGCAGVATLKIATGRRRGQRLARKRITSKGPVTIRLRPNRSARRKLRGLKKLTVAVKTSGKGIKARTQRYVLR